MGRAGETKAAEFLKDKGFIILERNFKTRIGEIDIIAKDGKTTVFIEVKTRTNDDYGAPSEAVTGKKREKYYLVASEYLQKNKLENSMCRFDVVEIENGQINHIEDAFGI